MLKNINTSQILIDIHKECIENNASYLFPWKLQEIQGIQ